jgi:hypothetical protein
LSFFQKVSSVKPIAITVASHSFFSVLCSLQAFADHIIRCKLFKPWEVHWKLQDPAILRENKLIPEKALRFSALPAANSSLLIGVICSGLVLQKRYVISAPSGERLKPSSDPGVRVAQMLYANEPSPRPADFLVGSQKAGTADGRRGSVSGRRCSISGAVRRASIVAKMGPRRSSVVSVDREALSATALERASDVVVATSEHLSHIAKRITKVRVVVL